MSDAPGAERRADQGTVTAAERRAGQRWVWGIVAALVATVALNMWVLRIAGADGGVNAEPDYYRKAVNWDQAQAAATASAALGWTADVDVVRHAGAQAVLAVTLRDRAGAPVRDARVTVRARWNGDARHAEQSTAIAAGDGYAVTLPLVRAGLYEFTVSAVRGDARFAQVLRIDTSPAVARR
ncbi:MAG: FixH family protein [Gemmatimonadaceae bacterium]|nr:FixH family protein [Gemmatimonadaceae bacterium]